MRENREGLGVGVEAPSVDENRARERMRGEVWQLLNRPQKELSSKWFYDAKGSALFDEITTLEEYYPTRTERAILRAFGPTWFEELQPRSLVELGAGSADKTRILLDSLPPASVYVPVDISQAYLDAVAEELGEEYPDLEVRPARSDITHGLDLPPDLPAPTVIAFLGSTIGNFDRRAAVRLLGRVRAALRPGDRFLMGADLIKDPAVLHAAYNDARGVTAAFNLNILTVLDREIGTDFGVDGWEHRAFFEADAQRIEMHLVARSAQTVTVPGRGTVQVAAGETIRTEISCKYDRATVEAFFADAGLAVDRWVTDERDWFALVVGRARG